MSQFIQLHFLTSYPPSNLNRDDLGRPKTAKMGNVDRLRISSQSLKRHWRISDVFAKAMSGEIGTRTKRIGVEVAKALQEKGMNEKKAIAAAKAIAAVFGKASKERELEIEQLVHLSVSERKHIDALVDKLVEENREPGTDELELLSKERMAVDIALFGRMLASKPLYNVEAACQVAHAISVHGVVIEDDYFTAVDDLNRGDEDRGSAHIGEAGFAAALFYHYICINRDLLVENLGGDEVLASQAIQALTEAALTVAPTGKQNSFAGRARASYVLAEKGEQQPRSLSVAFLQAINDRDKDILDLAIAKLKKQRDNFDAVYGACADEHVEMNAQTGEGSLKAVLDFVGA